jgi:hypothetical protein
MRDAIAGCGSAEGTITIVGDEIDHIDSTVQLFAFDECRDEVVISTHATTPLGYVVGSAMALAHPKLLHEALDEDTLTELLDHTPAEILSQARQIGHIPLDNIDADTLRQSLIKWGREIRDLTRRLKTGDYCSDDFAGRDEICREILQQGHGLIGSIVHLLDEAEISVVRDIRVPAGLNSSKLDDLCETIAHSIIIQSRYESYAAYRQLFEPRESHRKRTLSPKIDSVDPVGTLIGVLVIRGNSAPRLRSALITELKSSEPVSDAPEFQLPITIRNITRENVTVAAERVLERKQITLTQDAISILYAVVGSPYRVTKALQCLETSPEPREISPSELRVALRRLSAGDLFSELPKSIGQIVEALLTVTEPITQSELATRADVTSQTIRNYEDAMNSLRLIEYERTTSGKEWRVTLPFQWEQDDMILPTESEDTLDELISEQCECPETCVSRERKQSDTNQNCSAIKWKRIHRRLTAGEEITGGGIELQVGESPEQRSLLEFQNLNKNTGVDNRSEEFGQQKTPDDAQATPTIVQSAWTGPKFHDDLSLATSDKEIYSSTIVG